MNATQMMQAVRLETRGGTAALAQCVLPTLGADAVLVRVTRAGVNPVDWKLRDGGRNAPFTLGQDFAGVIEQIGSDVSGFSVGDRVFGCARENGSYAQFTAVPQDDHSSPIARIPAHLGDDVAAALPTPGLTALAAIDQLDPHAGDVLLILGAAGAVGGAAVQLARARGAVIVAVVQPGQAEVVQRFGATTVIVTDGDPTAQLAGALGTPFSRVFDTVSTGDQLKAYAGLLAPGAILISTTHAADETWYGERSVRASNIVMNKTPQSSPAGLQSLAAAVERGDLDVPIAGTKPLAEANALLDAIKAHHANGKYVLTIG